MATMTVPLISPSDLFEKHFDGSNVFAKKHEEVCTGMRKKHYLCSQELQFINNRRIITT